MSSNIPKARELLSHVLNTAALSHSTRSTISTALNMMTRSAPVKRAPAVRQTIDRKLRSRVLQLARQDYTHHEIAEMVGLRNSGRVSEILNGKR
ncbi:hypothetical protein [Bradyrhizobium sp. S3.7.6]